MHGISWPVSNPKRLNVEYATKDDMELARELSKDQPVSRKTEQLLTTDSWQQDWNREERTNSAKVRTNRRLNLISMVNYYMSTFGRIYIGGRCQRMGFG